MEGAWIIGGCCGTTPAHLEKMIQACKGLLPLPSPKKPHGSFLLSQAVTFGSKPVIIGERINPTGKSRFKQALREKDMNYILKEEGVAQQQNGAHILDVNVGLPEIDEVALMEDAIREIQSIIDLPLQIDTTNVEAMERALRIYNGKPLINSVNGKQESMHSIFPLIKNMAVLLLL